MRAAIATEIRQTVPDVAPSASRSILRRAVAGFWLNAMFFTVRRVPSLATRLRPLAIRVACARSHKVRNSTAANARRIFGPAVSRKQIDQYAKGVIGSFFDFVYDVGTSLGLSRKQLTHRIESAHGKEQYLRARQNKRGAIIATAHMGSFEAGAAGLLEIEPRIHVVFKRDSMGAFEQLRADFRRHLGVIEAPIDDGWSVWLRLREALQRDEVVMVQGDRVMPGQKGAAVPFLHGHLLLPTGPFKLAAASGAPIIPIFTIRTPGGGLRIHIEDPIEVEDSPTSPHPALLRFASVLEKYVSAYPEQWLLLHKAFVEDAA